METTSRAAAVSMGVDSVVELLSGAVLR